MLERIGRGLLLRGQALYAIDVERGALTLTEAVTWDVSGGQNWQYRADFATPSGTFSRTLFRPERDPTPAHRRRRRSGHGKGESSVAKCNDGGIGVFDDRGKS